jgi:alcohol dehydrogenase
MQPRYFEFLNPTKILSGKNALENVPHEIARLDARRPLIVTDEGVVEAGLIAAVEAAFEGSDVVIGAVFDRTPPDSSMQTVREIAALFREQRCDSILAVGGGSPIDTAKGVNVLVSLGADDLLPYMGADVLDVQMKPFVVIPTTAGTGSEVSSAAVIANPDKGVKMVIASDRLIPDVAVIDPRMTMTMPPRITAATGMDALAHAVEAYTCIQKNPVSDAFAFKAVEMIGSALLRSVVDGKDVDARQTMANAAMLSGMAFTSSMVGAVHALGHAVGAVSHVPHGNAMAVFLPVIMEFNMETVGDLYGELLLAFAGPNVYARTPASRRGDRCIRAVRALNAAMNDACGHATTLRACGVRRDDFQVIAQKAIDDGASLLNPRNLSHDDALSLLERAY